MLELPIVENLVHVDIRHIVMEKDNQDDVWDVD